MVTQLQQLDLNKRYTFQDYLSWRFMDRVELLWGKIARMAPAPSMQHQKIAGTFFREISNFLKESSCQVFITPFDVRLVTRLGDEQIESVVQPDIVVVCDSAKLDEQGCKGAPDLVIEILSPYSSTRDLKHKLKLYEEAGVQEYWVVDPHTGNVQVFLSDENGKYQSFYPVTAEDTLKSKTIVGLEIQLPEIFPDILQEPESWYDPEVRRL
jgi:Uma2 family endonuclease